VQAAVVAPDAVITVMGWAIVQLSAVAEPLEGVYVKATVPVGFVEPVTTGVMVAVKVTGWLTPAEGSEETTVVVVTVLLTVIASVPVLVPKLGSPVGYTALMT